jgi:hypothetical protein
MAFSTSLPEWAAHSNLVVRVQIPSVLPAVRADARVDGHARAGEERGLAAANERRDTRDGGGTVDGYGGRWCYDMRNRRYRDAHASAFPEASGQEDESDAACLCQTIHTFTLGRMLIMMTWVYCHGRESSCEGCQALLHHIITLTHPA